jgi:hypothetical protein
MHEKIAEHLVQQLLKGLIKKAAETLELPSASCSNGKP